MSRRSRGAAAAAARPSPAHSRAWWTNACAGAGVAVLLGASAIFGACAPIESISAGSCGNGVLEPGHDEDCDCYEPDGDTCKVEVHDAEGKTALATCNRAGHDNECRYACGADGVVCPGGWGCGIDHVCRAPNGKFRLLSVSVPLNARRLLAADFDGDSADDLMAVGSSTLDVLYYDSGGTVGKRLSMASAGDVPAVGDLNRIYGVDESPRADFMFNAGRKMAILSGQLDRSFTPIPVSSVQSLSDGVDAKLKDAADAEVESVRLVPLGIPTSRDTFKWFAAIKGYADKAPVLVLMYGSDDNMTPLMETDDMSSVIVGSPAMGDLDTATTSGEQPVNEVVLAFKDAAVVNVYAPYPETREQISQVALPTGARVVGAAFLHDVNADGNLDLLVSATCVPPATEGCLALDVAYGKGDGGFETMFPYGLLPSDSRMAPNEAASHPPLAVGYLDGDEWLDLVDASGIKRGNPDSTSGYQIGFTEILDSRGKIWADAQIGDFNGNGIPDVVTGSAQEADITFFNGAGPASDGKSKFNEFKIPTQGTVSSLTLGDFDGDLITDLAFIDNIGGLSSTVPVGAGAGKNKELSICFGQSAGAPELPVSMGGYPGLVGIASFRQPQSFDAISDLAVSYFESAEPNGKLAELALSIIEGNGGRQLLPAFSLPFRDSTAREQRPVRSFMGCFKGPCTTAGRPLDVATLQIDYDTNVINLWLLTLEDDWRELSIASSSPVSTGIPAQVDPRLIDAVAIDLDQNGHDELVLSWSLPADFEGQMPSTSVPAPLLVAHLTSGDAFDDEFEPVAVPAGISYQELRAGDLNGDGWPDLVAIARKSDAGDSDLGQAVVFWNRQDEQTGSRVLDAPSPIPLHPSLLPVNTVPVEEVDGPAVTGLDFANIEEPDSRGVRKSLVVLTSEAVYALTTCRAGDPECVLVGEKDLLSRRVLEGIPGGSAIVRCDVLGDGIDDLAVLRSGAVHVYVGTSLHR